MPLAADVRKMRSFVKRTGVLAEDIRSSAPIPIIQAMRSDSTAESPVDDESQLMSERDDCQMKLEEFYKRSDEVVASLHTGLEKAIESAKNLITLFGDNPRDMSWDDLFLMFKNFRDQFGCAQAHLREIKERQEKVKKQAAYKVKEEERKRKLKEQREKRKLESEAAHALKKEHGRQLKSRRASGDGKLLLKLDSENPTKVGKKPMHVGLKKFGSSKVKIRSKRSPETPDKESVDDQVVEKPHSPFERQRAFNKKNPPPYLDSRAPLPPDRAKRRSGSIDRPPSQADREKLSAALAARRRAGSKSVANPCMARSRKLYPRTPVSPTSQKPHKIKSPDATTGDDYELINRHDGRKKSSAYPTDRRRGSDSRR